MLEKARFAGSTYGARLFRHEKVAEGRPSARLGAFSEITKKNGAAVRVMREMSHRLVIFLSGTIKKCWKRPVLPIRRVGCRFFRHEKVAEGRRSARLGAFSEITKKQVSLYA